MASDSRSNAGVDQVASVRKMTTFERAGDRVLVLLAAGNLATTQSVSELLSQSLGTGAAGDLYAANTLFDATQIVGDTLRRVMDRDANYVAAHGDAGATFLFGGQIVGHAPRLFLIYSAGNFIEASDRCPYLQIGENKYGKPILDRAFAPEVGLDEACKLALLSFDATMRSNLSVGPPIDLARYDTDSLTLTQIYQFDARNPYFKELTRAYSDGLSELVSRLPAFSG